MRNWMTMTIPSKEDIMLDKKTLKVGDVCEVQKNMTVMPIDDFDYGTAKPGMKFEVVNLPKKIQGVNLLTIKIDHQVWWVHWNTARICSKII